MQKLLSIVIPVYKVEPYINKCLDSIVISPDLMQKLEVIIVNDGTPDNSAEMSREYVKRYPDTFRQIDKENGGHGSAWNVGLKEATGKYLRFLDSDDWLTNLPEFLEKLENCDADVVITRLNRFFEDRNCSEISQCPHTIDTVLPISRIGPKEFEEYNSISNFWFCTYKTELLKPLYPLFVEGVSYDDSILFIIPLLYAKDYIAYNLVLYNYLLGREGQSMAVNVQLKKIPDRIKVLRQMYSFVDDRFLERDNGWLLEEVFSSRRDILIGFIATVKSFRLSSSYNKEFQRFIKIMDYNPKSKLFRRYRMFPFVVFFIIERIRDFTSRN